MKIYYFLTPLLFICCFSLNAQKGEVRTGYLIYNDSIKVEGYVQPESDLFCMTRVKFSEKERIKKYPIIKTKSAMGYGFLAEGINQMSEPYTYWRHFMKYELDRPARMLSSTASFIERVVEGELVVYRFYYETPSDLEDPISSRYIVFQDGNELCQIDAQNFLEASKSLFEGYTALVDLLGDKKYRFENFIRLAEDYNYWIENQHDPKIYKLNPKIFGQ